MHAEVFFWLKNFSRQKCTQMWDFFSKRTMVFTLVLHCKFIKGIRYTNQTAAMISSVDL